MPPTIIDVETGYVSGLNGTHGSLFGGTFANVLNWGPSSISNFTIDPPSTAPVTIGALDVPMTIIANPNQVTVGNTTNGLGSISGALTVTGTSVLTLNDTNDVSARNVLMSRVGGAVEIDGLAPAPITYNLPGAVVGYPNVEMDLWKNYDGGTMTVLAAGQTGGLTKIVSNRSVAISVGNVTTTPDIQGALAIYCAGTSLTNTLHIDDSTDSAARNFTVGAMKDSAGTSLGAIRGLPGGGEVDYNPAQTAGPITIDGGSGGNTFSINATDSNTGASATGVPFTLNLGSGNDSANIKTNSVTINGQGGNDSATVDYSTVTLPNNGGTFSPGNVTFDGGANVDTLSILGKVSTQAFGVVATAVTQGAQTTTYSNVESLALSNGAFALANDLNGPNLTISGSGATASANTTQHLGKLTVDSSAVATIASSASTGGKTLFCTGIALTNSGALNIANNTVMLNYTSDPIAAIRGYLSNGYNSGQWNGSSVNGVIRSTSAASNSLNTSIGYADSADVGNPAGLPASTIMLQYAAIGDTNLDKVVDLTDLAALLKSYNTGTNWDQGNLQYHASTGLTDLAALLKHYNDTVAGATPGAAPAAAVAPTTQPTATSITALPAVDSLAANPNHRKSAKGRRKTML